MSLLLAGWSGIIPHFQNRQPGSGIGFILQNSPTSDKFLIETMTGGCAFLDYDGDGLLDVFLVNGAAIITPAGQPPRIDKTSPRYWNRLYRNLGRGRFEDVTEKAGLQGSGYGMGVAVGDYDGDGRPDIFVTNYGRNELFRNQGDGTFREVTAAAGVAGGGFSTSAAFFDYDRDGRLDLYVCRYVDWSFANHKRCDIEGKQDYCHPREFHGVAGLLYHNNGDGTFTDVSVKTGVALDSGKGLGVAVLDFDRDGWPDLFVANDSVPSFLLHNRQGRVFEEIGLAAGTALRDSGATFAGMGADAADYDNDGWPDIFATALSLEGFPLFHNNHDGSFDDLSERAGIRRPSFYLAGWGTHFLDFDNDGWKDLFVANSHVMTGIERSIRTLTYPQPLLMLRNRSGAFSEVNPSMGSDFQTRWTARGAAFGDLDNDGDTDILVQVLGGPPLLLENLRGNQNHWLGLQLASDSPNREAIGASVDVTSASARQSFRVSRSGSYLSSSDARILAGLGSDTQADVRITWPSGTSQTLHNLKANAYLRIPEPRN